MFTFAGIRTLSAGVKWLREFAVPCGRRVLYIDEEMGAHPIERRIHRLGAGAGIVDDIPFRVLSRPGLTFDPDGLESLIEAFSEQGFDPEVIVVDSLRRVLVGSENDAEAIAKFWRILAGLYTGRTVIIIHHMKKPTPQGGNDPRYRASGSTDLLAGADVAFAVTRARGDAMLIECVKSRHGIEPAPFLVSLSDEVEDGPIVIRYEGSRTQAAAAETAAARAAGFVVSYVSDLPDQTASTADIKRYLSDQQVSDRTADRALSDLRRAGRLEWPNGKRGWCRLVNGHDDAA